MERAAGALFRDVSMDAIADDEPSSVQELAVFQQDGRTWVATDHTGQPVVTYWWMSSTAPRRSSNPQIYKVVH